MRLSPVTLSDNDENHEGFTLCTELYCNIWGKTHLYFSLTYFTYVVPQCWLIIRWIESHLCYTAMSECWLIIYSSWVKIEIEVCFVCGTIFFLAGPSCTLSKSSQNLFKNLLFHLLGTTIFPSAAERRATTFSWFHQAFLVLAYNQMPFQAPQWPVPPLQDLHHGQASALPPLWLFHDLQA